jgi:hypothetical protein
VELVRAPRRGLPFPFRVHNSLSGTRHRCQKIRRGLLFGAEESKVLKVRPSFCGLPKEDLTTLVEKADLIKQLAPMSDMCS